MRFLWPMAYVFLSLVSDKKSNVNSELTTANENLTYRLMEFERKKGNGEQPDSVSGNSAPANHDYPTHMVPRRRSPRYQSPETDDVNPRKEVPASLRENMTQTTTPRPRDRGLDEFEEEIAKFRIAAGVTKRQKGYPKKKKRQQPQSVIKSEKNSRKEVKKEVKKKKPVLEELDEALKFDFENEDNNKAFPTHAELGEEEQTEEKKEKFRKVTIKTKKPVKNKTRIIRHQRQQPLPVYQVPHQLPYRTIIEENEKIVTRKRKPSAEMLKVSTKPLILKENVETLNPAFYHDKNVRKGVKARDVNVFVRTRTKNPKILIRRYKPFLSVINVPIVKGKYSGRRKQKRKHRRRRKKLRKEEDVDEDFSSESSKLAKQVSCSTEPPTQPPERFATSNAFPVFGTMGAGPNPYNSMYPSFPPIKPESIRIPEETIPFPDDYQQYPSGTFSVIQQLTTASPAAAIRSEKVVADDDEPIQTAYDILGHKNTEALAALHEKETDDTVDNEDEEPHFTDDDTNAAMMNDAEDGVDEVDNTETEPSTTDYENDEGESSPHWKMLYGYQPQKISKKIPSLGA